MNENIKLMKKGLKQSQKQLFQNTHKSFLKIDSIKSEMCDVFKFGRG